MIEYSERFTGKAAEYAQYRERYDAEVVLPLLREWCGLMPEWRVADVGAGTGMAGDLFRANGNPVIAIEPNAEMRAACASLHEEEELFTVVDGSAEKTGLQDASMEMIAVGRALHWFNVDAALREFRRILKPKGWVAILACGRAEDGREENLEFKKLMQTHTNRDLYLDSLLAVYRQLETLFTGGPFFHAEPAGEMHFDWEQLRGMTLSLSHAPMPGSAAFPAFEAELRGYFDRYEQNGRITMTTRTWVSAGQFGES
jgi:ubiquinone/menaquinone biosynthesis C-methylase UbiE